MNSIDIKEITIEDLVKDVSNEDMISEEEAIKHYEKILRNDFKEDVDTLAPTFISSSTISVDENQTNAITLRATDTNTGSSNTITYSISGTDSSFFKIKTSSGVVTFKSPPNYELLKTSYTFIAKAKDSKNNIASQDITITIVNVAEVPTLANSIGSVVENSIANTSVGTIDITNTGDSAITNIVLSGTDASNFNVNTSGAITVSNAASLDYETTHTDNLTVIATNSAGNSNSANVTRIVDDITVLNIKSAVYDNNMTTNIINDDKLYLYFNKSIDESSILIDRSLNYIIHGT